MQTIPSAVPISTKNFDLEEVRRSVTYDPSIWGDYFLTYSSDRTEMSVAEKKEHEIQKDVIRKLVIQTPDDPYHKPQLIDAIQRLGVGYHFENEIHTSLQCIHQSYTDCNSQDNDLHAVALRFRLLRQHGFFVQCDVFSKFIEKEGKFKESLKSEVKGMISLYEAAHFAKHGEEEILEKALEFCTSHLHSATNQTNVTCSLKTQVNEALRIPIRKSLCRVEARKFMSMYQEDENHNETLLNFAKLDFNMLQKIHQKELRDLTRWWKDLDFANKLEFARDRMVECYFWILGVYFEPQYQIGRRFLTKVISMAAVIDDVYDIRGTLEDLQLFTDAIQRWDITAMEELPSYMRVCYKALIDIYDEMEDELEKVGKSYRIQYAKDEMKKLVRVYFKEARWFYGKYMPTMEEYMEVGVASSGYMMMSATSMVVMGDLVTKEDFDWVINEPLIVQASSTIARLMDDIVGYGFETKRTSVHCYMEEKGATEIEAFSELKKQVKKAWKDINEECMEPRAVSMEILTRIVNLACVINLLYADEDGFGNSKTKTKDSICSLLVEPVTV